MEPWLDSLSEDWKSEQRSSSPAPSLPLRRQSGSISLSGSQSRIPHLANSIRKDSNNGSFLRLRSTRGKALSRGEPVLKERTPSSLNVLGPSGSQKYSSLPRRASSVFSDSQNSVQHHSVREQSIDAETPEWKKRLVKGEDLTSDGFDLFSPSKLEGVFKEPTPSQLRSENDPEQLDNESLSRKPFALPQSNTFPQQFSSYRPPRNRLNDLEVLQEVTEDEEADRHDMSAISSELGRTGSLRGLVRNRVRSLERTDAVNAGPSSSRPSSSHSDKAVRSLRDPRWRTVSGQEELKNEFISPVTISKQNSIRVTAVRNSLDMDVKQLQSKLKVAAANQEVRPTSSSSDKDISYGHISAPADESKQDTTSQSLPDDLSMGTAGFSTYKVMMNARNAIPSSSESSMLPKDLSITEQSSHIRSGHRAPITINSSPPQHSRLSVDSFEHSHVSASAIESPQDTSVLHHVDAHVRPSSSGSPLKLFGNRDTYTNNKLMRILSQFEETSESSFDDLGDKLAAKTESILRMSQFGLGDLDDFGFEKEVPRPSPIQAFTINSDDRIFRHSVSKAEAPATPESSPVPANTSARDFQVDVPPVQSIITSRNDRTTTKRRKTLLDDHISVQDQELEVKITQIEEVATLAGTKRKDARPGDDGTLADPDILASRSLLRPVSASQRSNTKVPSASADIVQPVLVEEELTEALATELAHFAKEAVGVAQDSRKPSMATKDYMEEANKVMEFIRSKGKPLPHLTTIRSEVGNDADIDQEFDPDSTKDSFTRPPSRERVRKPRPDPRHPRHDSRIASYLRKYREDDDTENLTNISAAFGTLPVDKDASPTESKPRQDSISGVHEEQESNPPNMRILNHDETLRKRKHSASTVEGAQDSVGGRRPQSQDSSDHSTQHTFPTSSSTSGPKGVIASGTISIPDQVAGLTFDNEKKLWVKKLNANDKQQRPPMTEDDPFDSIPDLSVDETHENAAKAGTTKGPSVIVREPQVAQTVVRPTSSPEHGIERRKRQGRRSAENSDEDETTHSSLRSKASRHEAKLHEGVPSEPPAEPNATKKQPRVVTIAFSSPVVSAINYTNISEDDIDDLPREEDLPLDESEIDLSDMSVRRHTPNANISPFAPVEQIRMSRFDELQTVAFQPRTISPIAEQDEETGLANMSLVPVTQAIELTPAPQRAVIKHHKGAFRASSILCLTPLSDFSLHQVDVGKNPDQSYVEERQHPHALRQAHGSLTLAVDELIKAITDAAGDELFWEKLRQIDIAPGKLSSVHSLKEYCPVLNEISIPDNMIEHVGGLPGSVRTLDIHNNMLNDLTSWGHLANLQYLDVSGNQLETLDGFSSLVHLRSLKANNNRIASIDGIFNLKGLLDLQLRDNDISAVNFAGADLRCLKTLDLCHNGLREVRNLHNLPRLEELDISHNAIEEWLPEQSTRTISLRKLRASHNMLTSIHLTDMPILKSLDLDNNSINQIFDLSTAYNLGFLSLRDQDNAPNIVDLVLSTPHECRHIRLSSNTVANGSFALPSLPQYNLRELELAACGISTLPTKFGSSFPNCRQLNVNFNAINELTPLRGMVKLTHMFAAKNRISRLRRTCILMSKLTSLREIDIRENPLTVGFYSPTAKTMDGNQPSEEATYRLPEGSIKRDPSWIKRLDEVTGLKRRTIELLLTENCKNLVQLDGMPLHRAELVKKDRTWDKLTERGVLAIPVSSPTASCGSKIQTPKKNRASSEAGIGRNSATKSDGDVFDG